MCLEKSFAKKLAAAESPPIYCTASFPVSSPEAIYETTAAGALSVASASSNDIDDNDFAPSSWCLLRYP